MDLNARFNELGSRKGTNDKDYCKTYVRIFEHLRKRPIRLLELGLNVCGSVKAWLEYFDDVFIVGIDNEHHEKIGFTDERFRFEKIDQGNLSQMERLCGLGPYDIIVDDCSHQSAHIIWTLGMLFPVLNPGGYFCIEDLDARRARKARKMIGKHWKDLGNSFESVQMVDDNLFVGKK